MGFPWTDCKLATPWIVSSAVYVWEGLEAARPSIYVWEGLEAARPPIYVWEGLEAARPQKETFFTWALIISTIDRKVSLAPRLSFHSDRSTESLGAKVGQHKFGVTNPLLVGSTFCNQIVCIAKQAMWKIPMIIDSRQDGLFPRFDWLLISYFWWFDWSVRIPCICCRQDGAVYNPPEWC